MSQLKRTVVAAGLAVFAITEPHAAGSAFKSTKAIVLMVAVAVVWIGARLALWFGVRWPGVRLAVFACARNVYSRLFTYNVWSRTAFASL